MLVPRSSLLVPDPCLGVRGYQEYLTSTHKRYRGYFQRTQNGGILEVLDVLEGRVHKLEQSRVKMEYQYALIVVQSI